MGAWSQKIGNAVPNYQICYLDNHGSLACSFSALCASETQAKVLAHAMKLSDYKSFEVWRDRTLVYARPQAMEMAIPPLQ